MKTANEITARMAAGAHATHRMAQQYCRVVDGPLQTAMVGVIAGELEYESWLEELRYARDGRCPDGRFHDEVPAAAKSPSFYARCRRCGHNTILPF